MKIAQIMPSPATDGRQRILSPSDAVVVAVVEIVSFDWAGFMPGVSELGLKLQVGP